MVQNKYIFSLFFLTWNCIQISVCQYCTEYVDDLMDLVFEKVFVDPAPYTEEIMKISIPEDLCANYERPDKESVINNFVSRFNAAAVWNPRSWPGRQETPCGSAVPHRPELQRGSCAQESPSTSSQSSCMPDTCIGCKIGQYTCI